MTTQTQTFYSDDGESSIFAEVVDDELIAIFVSSGFAGANIELDKESIIEFARSLILMASESWES